MSITRKDCIAAIRQHGFSEFEAEQSVDGMVAERKRLEAAGKLERGAADLAEAVSDMHDQQRIDNVLARRNTALTIMYRADNEKFIADVMASGKFDAVDAFEAMTVGSPKRGLVGTIKHIDAQRIGIEEGYKDRLTAEWENIGKQAGGGRSHVFKLLSDNGATAERLDFLREVFQPGSTRNSVMAKAADAYLRMAEEMRQRHNAAGANIGKLEGRFPQSHDPVRLLDRKHGGQQGWVDTVLPLLDRERTFAGKADEEAREILNSIYHTLAQNRDLGIGGGASFGPRNLASGLGKHRVLHFRDAESFYAYHEKYGRGTLVEAIDGELRQGARRLALMERLGPNPESMFRSLVEGEKARIRAEVESGARDPVAGKKALDRLESACNTKMEAPAGKLANYMKVLTGETMSPVDTSMARIGSSLRALQAMSKLGAAALSAMTDPHLVMSSQRIAGVDFAERWGNAIFDYFKRFDGDERALAHELGFLNKMQWGGMVSRFDPQDTTPGRLSKAMNHFYHWSGLDWVSEQKKATHALTMSRHLARSKDLPFDKLIPELRGLLEYNGVDAAHWDAWRLMTEKVGGDWHLTPARARTLTDGQLAHLLPEHLQGDAPPKGYTPETFQAARQRELSRLRQRIETDMLAFFADDSKFAVMEPDARVTALMTQGTRPSTVKGEILRAIMQFKSWPLMFVQRQIRGQRWQKFGAEGFDALGAIEFMVAGTAFGYLATTLKDISRGRTPKDINKWETWLAAWTQMGAAGIYGDFAFGPLNRHGNTFMGNLPWINMACTRKAADVLLLDSLKEKLSPGYKQRMRREMERTCGQKPLW